MATSGTRRIRCVQLAAATIAIGLIWRLVPLGLPPYPYKYGGSVLWAAMVYWLVAAVLPEWSTARVAVAACLIAALVELSRLHHSASEDAFRMTLAGRLLLGRVFSVWDIVTYWLAIAVIAAFDARHRRA